MQDADAAVPDRPRSAGSRRAHIRMPRLWSLRKLRRQIPVGLFDRPGGRKRRGVAITRHSIAWEAINDFARLILHDDGGVRILGPAFRAEIIEHPACNFDCRGVILESRSLRIPKFRSIRIDHGEEIARHASSMCAAAPKEKSPIRSSLPRLKLHHHAGRPSERSPSRVQQVSRRQGSAGGACFELIYRAPRGTVRIRDSGSI
jgi:hypothetical protein